MIKRRLLTRTAQETLADVLDKPVGHSNAPKAGGWQGEPNAEGTGFIPYVVITPATLTYKSGPIADSSADLHVPYTLSCFGVTPESCEWMADEARTALAGLVKTILELGDGNYKVQKIDIETIGGLQRVDATDPPFWGELDSISIWLSKELV